MEFDTIIRNGTLIDGSGSPAAHKDVGIVGERIAAIDDLSTANAARVIDASNLVVAPGFIDIHSHADYTLPTRPTADSKTHQGVTTELVGNCGTSSAPLSPEMQAKGDANSLLGNFGLSWDWDTFGSYLDRLRSVGTAVNVAMLVGHGTVREKNMGMTDAKPAAEQVKAMQKDVSQAMKEGAWGLSTGLIYPPGVFADIDEIAALAGVAAREGGIYTSHIRGEAGTVLQAVGEAIEIGRRAHIPVEISHLKAEQRVNWPKMQKVVEIIRDARQEGLDVYADMYPYNAFCTVLSSMLPAWAVADGKPAIVKRLSDENTRAEIRKALARDAEDGNPGYWQGTLITYCEGRPEYSGRNLQDLAEEMGKPPEDTVMDILLYSNVDAGMVQFAMSEENVEYGLQQDFIMIGSDGEGRAVEGILSNGNPHPRNYGTFARVLGYFARQRKIFSLETAVYKMTGLPAKRIGLHDRGLLKSGYFADVTIFNSQTVIDKATFIDPHQYAEGIEYVLVNGTAVIEKGIHTRALPGRVLVH